MGNFVTDPSTLNSQPKPLILNRLPEFPGNDEEVEEKSLEPGMGDFVTDHATLTYRFRIMQLL